MLWYKKKLSLLAEGKPITDSPPSREMHDAWVKGKEGSIYLANQTEKGIVAIGDFLDKKMTESGLTQKINDFFGHNRQPEQ